ncbi:MAG: Smr/MutS family protein [Alphaproteobacteria bacterium]|nr:Smr/MutS family protein [Alphaproteobacteria bacterium]
MPPGDEKIWAVYTKSVKRLARGTAPLLARRDAKDGAAPKPDNSKRETRTSAAQISVAAKRKAVSPDKDKSVSAPLRFDRQTERKLRRGTAALEAKLDLHGLTQEKAHAALTRFIKAQSAQGRRRLLVITGKGRGGESVLRASLPRWCAEAPFAAIVLALRPAAPQHGGGGAWYVLLRNSTRKKGAKNVL